VHFQEGSDFAWEVLAAVIVDLELDPLVDTVLVRLFPVSQEHFL
jgi:hypothetical protein